MKFAIQLQLKESEDSAGIAGEGTSSETSKNGTGPRPIENDACPVSQSDSFEVGALKQERTMNEMMAIADRT